MTRSRVRSTISILALTMGLLGVSASQAAASPGAYQVLYISAIGGCTADTSLPTQLAGMPGVTKVDTFDGSASTPSVAQLDLYDEVIATSDCDAYDDGVTFGNNLADYADTGGVVVEYGYSTLNSPDYQIGGRWLNGGYTPYLPGPNVNNNVTLGAVAVGSPLMTGVSNLTSGGCNTDPTLAPGATRVATWNNAQEAIAVKGQAVAVTAMLGEDGCPFSGDYARLTLNAVTTLDKKPVPLSAPSGTAISKAKINRKKRSAKFLFSAAGTVTGFECALGRKKKGKKLKLSFRGCTSPKRYKHLKPGKYKFEARGVNASGPDSVPAKRKFKI